MKNILLLGSTGSIGRQTLDVIRFNKKSFKVRYLTAHRNFTRLIEQAEEFRPQGVVVTDEHHYITVKNKLNNICHVFSGMKGILKILNDPEIHLVVNGLVGAVGVLPTYHAILSQKDIALANKETLVVAGQLIMNEVNKRKINLIPIDSEHSAIWQCIRGEDKDDIRRIILTASGGPFVDWPKRKLKEVSVEQALQHPNWQMGSKITIDSATLMNKGLELIEAYWLYRLPVDRIEVIIHHQSVIHSFVEFCDGSLKAQLSLPDMHIPIQYALSFPKRLPYSGDYFALKNLNKLTFDLPDHDKFPCLMLAYQALKEGGTTPAVMNMANETAVDLFLKKLIGFTDIPKIIEKTMQAHVNIRDYNLPDLENIQLWAKEFALKSIK